MFKKGDLILHPQHGAGTVTSIRTCKVGGVRRRYYSIKLVNASGTLMIPVDQAETTGLRQLDDDVDRIVSVLREEPEKLAADHRKRQARLTAKIHSGDPKLMAQALRDLVWRETDEKLSMGDEQLRNMAQALLAGILALQSDLSFAAADHSLRGSVQQAIQSRTTNHDGESPGADTTDAARPRRRRGKIHPFLGIRPF